MIGNGAAAGVDVGGTFTDVVVVGEDGAPAIAKVPTTPGDQSEGVAAGLEAARPGTPVARVAHGTTVATNAVLEREVARTVLVVTEGFRDLLVIGRQDRPSLYDLDRVRPEPLVSGERVVAVRERTGPDGAALVPLEAREVEAVVERARELGAESAAVSLLFSYAGPEHEERIAAALEEGLGIPVSRSSSLLPEFREYERTSTTVLNAAVAPVMARYLSRLVERLPSSTVSVMTSGGGTAGVEFAARAPVHTLLSGPAAGVVAAAAVAAAGGFEDAVAFDMGGTSTDVCLVRGGRPEVLNESEIGGLPSRVPAVAVHTVGAGGGSIAWMDRGGALRVGPRSAGARPGPACYGLGGTEPTVTDAHAVLGHLDPAGGLGSEGLPLRPEEAVAALATLPEGAGGAEGVLAVVRATMARALRRVTTERGVSPGGLALVAYGGAGPLHATALARELGCPAVVIPPAPGVLSALGLLLAPPRYEASRTVMAGPEPDLESRWRELEGEAEGELRGQGIGGEVDLDRFADCRYRGQSHELRVAVSSGFDPAPAFHAAHRHAYGYAIPEGSVEVVTLRVVATGRPVLLEPPRTWELGGGGGERHRTIGGPGREVRARVVDRSYLRPGDELEGPALVEQVDATTLLEAGDRGTVDERGNLVVRIDG